MSSCRACSSSALPHIPSNACCDPPVQVLTGGVVKGAPLVFDLLAGTVSCPGAGLLTVC